MNPADAKRYDELGAAFLLAHQLARRDEDDDSPWQPALARRLPAIHTPAAALAALSLFRLHEGPDAAEVLSKTPASSEEITLEDAEQRLVALTPAALRIIDSLLQGIPFDPARPPLTQLGGEPAMFASSLATARAGLDALRGRRGSYPVAAAPRPRPELPTRYDGPVHLVHIVDLAHPGSRLALEEDDEPFDSLVEHSTQHFLHGANPDDPISLRAAHLAEAVARVCPERFWQQAVALALACEADSTEEIEQLLTLDVADRVRVLSMAEAPEVRAAVDRDLLEARACGVPSIRPASTLGTQLFTTVDLPDLDAAVWRAAGFVPTDLSWAGVLGLRPPGLELTHETGSANDPGDPFGAERLVMHPDGRLELHWSHLGAEGELSGRCPEGVVAEVFDLLSTSPFPDLPKHPLRPGPSWRVFQTALGERTARAVLARHPLESQPPYERICKIVDSLAAQLRGRSIHPARDPIPGVVQRD